KVNNAVDAVTLPPGSSHRSVESVHGWTCPPTSGHRVRENPGVWTSGQASLAWAYSQLNRGLLTH
ncbi:MAG: hypothetical protein OXC69_09700, partial [Candidatus Tectomicrobia bacterium]|nr:hypothetical protein [Candidatus Tectomicrobia bacterium]